jgi:hypothetical protein
VKESKEGRNGSWIVEVGLVVETKLVKLMSEAKQTADPNRARAWELDNHYLAAKNKLRTMEASLGKRTGCSATRWSR